MSIKTSQVIRVLIIAVLIGAVFYLFRSGDLRQRLIDLLESIRQSGNLAPVIYSVVYVMACVFFIPGSVLTLGAGFLFGLVYGSVIVSISATLGAAAAFLTGRYLAREWINSKVSQSERFQSIDDAVAREGGKIVFLTRLSPVFPFNLLNYAYGLTRIRFRDYFIASWAGMLPGTILYVYLGSLAGDLASLGSRSGERSPAEWAVSIVGLAATFAVTLYVTRLAGKALKKKTEGEV